MAFGLVVQQVYSASCYSRQYVRDCKELLGVGSDGVIYIAHRDARLHQFTPNHGCLYIYVNNIKCSKHVH